MLSVDFVLYIIAFVLFCLAGFSVPATVRWEWLGAAVLVLSLIV
jgi:hypothetical protein